ncbi:MAG: Cna B-type domain-containing protein [Erysipelotrichaceae bacterium]|nr:Cna B-type domain-containing protein [Erysipelotrichaceae bacterium]
MNRISKYLLTLIFVLSMLVSNTLGLSPGANVVKAAAGDPPRHSKSSEDNGDGTHKIKLSVTGDADENVEEAGNVNVIIVYDVSQSMQSNAGSSSNSRADEAEDVMHDFLTSLAGYQNDAGDNINLAIVTFSTGASQPSGYTGWTQNITGAANLFDDGTGEARNPYNMTYNGYGTNWEIALRQARQLERNQTNGYPTFVLLLTDGAPTDSESHSAIAPTGATIQQLRERYNAATDEANDLWEETEASGGAFYGIYAYGTEADLLDDLMYFAENGGHRGGSINNVVVASNPVNHYYNAADTAALNNAITEIFNEVVSAMGITAVSMSDGTTNQVKASSGEVTNLLGVDEGTYEYWMDIPLVNNAFTRKKNVTNASGINEVVEFTYRVTDNGDGTCTVSWTENGTPKTETVNGSVSSGTFNYKWEDETGFYEFKPNDATLTSSGSVDWDLSNVGVLLSGVTYSVTFDVYPSQTAMDYKARLDNGEAYTDVVPEHAREYFHSDGSLETNTEGTITYSDTRLENPGPRTTDFINPPAIATEASSMTVEKKWEGGTAPNIDLQVEVIMDGDEEEPFETVTLNSSGGWTADIHISYGVMRDGVVMSDAPGHDFAFAELGDEQYHWELVAPTVHPMIIDGEETMLIKVDENFPLDGRDPIEINGEQYYIDEEITTLSATNYRRSNLNLTKVVDGEGAPDTAFPFSITVDNIKAPDSEPEDDPNHNSDYWVWFSVRDAEGNYITDDANVQNATQSGNYFYAKSGDTITVDMKAGWNMRFTNLPSGSTYEIEEGDVSGFKFISAESTGAEDETFEADGKTATGTIVTYNAQAYEVTYTNEYASVNVTVTKEWSDGSDQDGIRPDTLELTLNGLPADVEAPEPEITVSEDGNSWTYTWSGLPKYDSDGEDISYTITEDSVPEGYTCKTTTVDAGGTITNTHTPEMIDIKVTKVWVGPESTATIHLLADGEDTGKSITLPNGGSNEYTFMNMPKYADGTEIVYSVSEDPINDYAMTGPTGDAENGFTITNTNTETITVTVTKVWEDADDQDGLRPESLTLTLNGLPDGTTAPTPTIAKSDDGNTWTYTWTGVPKYDTDGEAIEYTISETVPEGYTCEPTDGTVDAGGTLTNTHTPGTVDLTLIKVWNDADNQDGKRPSASEFVSYVTLSANGTDVTSTYSDKFTITDNGNGTYTLAVEGLPEKAAGETITYVWGENELPNDYQQDGDPVVNGNTTTITNMRVTEQTTYQVTKVWDDSEDQDGARPDTVKIQLYRRYTQTTESPQPVEPEPTEKAAPAEAVKEEAKTEEAAVEEKAEAALAETEAEEAPVEEKKDEAVSTETEAPAEEKAEENAPAEVAENEETPAETAAEETAEETKADDAVPAETVEEAKSEAVTEPETEEKVEAPRKGATRAAKLVEEPAGDPIELDEGSYTWRELDKYIGGAEITYFAKELNENGEPLEDGDDYNDDYVVSYNESESGTSLVITNTHEPDEIDITVVKVWQDEENADGVRPTTLTVTLSDGKTQATLNEGNQWTATVTVPKYAGGEEIEYTWSETVPDKYELVSNVTSGTTTTITNKHTPETIDITVVKKWNDVNDKEKLRPKQVTVHIFAGDEEIETFTLDESNKWTATLEGVRKYANGKEITYKVTEDSVASYTTAITGSAKNGFTVTNSHTPPSPPTPPKPPVPNTAGK